MRAPAASRGEAGSAGGWARARLGLLGLFMGLALIKFGIPVIMDDQVAVPGSVFEALIAPWPVAWGYFLFVVVAALCVPGWRWPSAEGRGRFWRVWVWLPFVWLGWQGVSGLFSVEPRLTWMVLPHFAVCVGLFALGLGVQGATGRGMDLFWGALCGSALVVFAVGWRQHFGGLEETRQFLYSLPNWRELPPEFLQKVSSNRVYGTLVYPNTLAGVVLLLTPVSAVCAWQAASGVFSGWRAWVGPALVVVLGAGCLYWSGSKAGWLLALGQVAMVAWELCPRRYRMVLVMGLLAVGLGLFVGRYGGYLQSGAKSVSARFHYWRSCWLTLKESPVLGSGPGTFQFTYARNKVPEAEMARLAHNDYLQQGSDSGAVGMLAYGVWFLGGVVLLYRNRDRSLVFGVVWLGLAALAGQGVVEFGGYVPAVGWLTFFLMGWLGGGANAIDKRVESS